MSLLCCLVPKYHLNFLQCNFVFLCLEVVLSIYISYVAGMNKAEIEYSKNKLCAFLEEGFLLF